MQIHLNGNDITNREQLHDALSEALELPEWYGRSLDALSACLPDLSVPAASHGGNLPEEDEVRRALAGVRTFLSFALIIIMIRRAIYSKRFLIHTMKLVGASWSFIRGPFLRKNVWSGVLAGMLADAILMGTAYWAVTYEQELIQVITPEVMLIVCGSVLVFGIVIT